MPYALLILLMTLYTRSDMIIMQQLLPDGNYQAGIYAQSFRILDAAAMFSLLFASWLLPIFSRMIKRNDNLDAMLNLSFFSLIVPVLISIVAIFFYNHEIIHALYHHAPDDSKNILRILMISYLSLSVIYIFGTLLTAGGKIKILNQISFIGLIANIILNLIFIPLFKALGAAMAATITQSLVAILSFGFALHIYKIKLNSKKSKALLFYFVLLVFIASLTIRLPYFWIINFSIFVLIALGLSFILGIFKIKSLKAILKEQSEY
jgi:O-antigen/teichoic acid export membrane protein